MVCTNGILADSDIQALIDSSVLKAICPFDADQIQPASIDLRLGKKHIVYVLPLCQGWVQKFLISLNG